ncbi:hypothetical protein LCDV1gp026 [Lymphocystis disease virus 1]|uniref:hypothetical protein n=1 Tax=Fish lymphocystis disease virus TaxID=36363 RepID=UPI0000161EDE|nr:hypothetical protein LCDV1gp026 [Lymphocystis disease virus 1]
MFLGFIYYNQTIITLFVATPSVIKQLAFPPDLKLVHRYKFKTTTLFMVESNECTIECIREYDLNEFNPFQYNLQNIILQTSVVKIYLDNLDFFHRKNILFYLDVINGCSLKIILTVVYLLTTFLLVCLCTFAMLNFYTYLYKKHNAAIPRDNIIILSDLPPNYQELQA